MPVFASILAFLNIVAAGAFIYLAALDWNVRQVWAREAFRHELALDGLPVDDQDPGRRILGSQADDLSDDQTLLSGLFKAGGANAGKPVATQKQEVENVRKALIADLEKPGIDVRQRVGALLMAQATTWEDRDAIAAKTKDAKVSTDDLKADLLAKFDNVLAADAKSDKHSGGVEKQDTAARRRAIAHLLYNLYSVEGGVPVPLVPHARLAIIVGVKNYTREAELQATALREMAERTKLLTLDDRNLFELEYLRNRDRIIELAQQNEKIRIDLQNRKTQSTRLEKEVIEPQQVRIEQLTKELEEAKQKASAELAEQAKKEGELFEIHQRMGELMDDNRKMEQQIRDRELGRTRTRGGQQ